MIKYSKAKFDSMDEAKRFVAQNEKEFEEKLTSVIRDVSKNHSSRIISLTGPTCSGKTTTAKKIISTFKEYSKRVNIISIDDFYFDKEYLQKRADDDPTIEIDYDSEDTIDVDLLAEQTDNLLSCKRTYLPHFDFQTGKRTKGEYTVPQKEDIFLFEGIQILYPRVNAILNHSPTYRSIYICPTSGIRIGEYLFDPCEIRLMRRLVRDFRHRASDPEFTFYLWKSVRENEEKNIFPYVHNCHATIDSTMPYEIGMLKPYLIPLLESLPKTSEAYNEAQRMLAKIISVQSVKDIYMTENSLYKEFI